MIAVTPTLPLLICGIVAICETKTDTAMNDEFIISTEPQSEDQKNRERIGLLRVADNYPNYPTKDHKSRKLLLEHIAESYE